MKRLIYILLLLPIWANAQVNGTIQKTASSGTVRGNFGSSGLDTLPRATGVLLNGRPLIYNSVLNKWTASLIGVSGIDTTLIRTVANSRSLAQTQTALNLKANLASPTFTGTVTAPTFSGNLATNFLTGTSLPAGIVSSGITTVGALAGGSLTTGFTPVSDALIASSANWNTAFADRLKWDGGTTGLVAATGRASLGGTTIGQNLFTQINPSAVTFPRYNADNTVSALDAATFRAAIGAGTGSGTITSVTGTANQITVTGTTAPVISLPATITGLTSVTSTGNNYAANFSNLNGKRWVIYGDSFSDNLTNDYVGTVKNNLNLTATTNAISGALISNCVDTLQASITLNATYLNNFDILSLHVGVNDFGNGSISLGNINSLITDISYAGKLKKFIEVALGNNPSIKIYLITPPEANGSGIVYHSNNASGWSLADLSALIGQIGRYYSVQVIDLYSNSGFNDKTITTLTADGLHPSAAGNTVLGNIVSQAFLGNSNKGLPVITNSLLTDNIPRYTGVVFKPGSITDNGSLITVSSPITSTATSGNVFLNTSAGNNQMYMQLSGSGVSGLLAGVESTVAGTTWIGSTASATLIGNGSSANKALDFGTNGTVRYEISNLGNHDFKTGNATFGGSVTGTSLTMNGTVNTNAEFAISATNAGTGRRFGNWANTSGSILWGIESSAGSSLFTGAPAYAAGIGSNTGGGAFVLGTNGVARVSISYSGDLSIITSPTTSAGTYDILTRNTSTGVVEKATTSGTGSVVALSASPALTGIPTASTATAGTNTTQLATTAFVQLNSGRQLEEWVVTASNTGTTDTDLYTFVVPANTLVNNGDKLVFNISGVYGATSNAKTLTIRFVTGFSPVVSTLNGAHWAVSGYIIKTGASTYAISFAKNDGSTSGVIVGNGSTIDFTIANTFKLSATGGATGDIVAYNGYLEFKPAGL